MEQENWNCCGFDDSSWKAGILCKKSYANLVAQYGEPVRPVKEVPAVGMTVSPKGETIIDFGQNLGRCSAGKKRNCLPEQKWY